jgi:hypothetical protein
MLMIGYLYGAIRANLLEVSSHFLFDVSVVGLYAAQLPQLLSWKNKEFQVLKLWLIILIGWPVLLFFVPIQDPIVELVGLRASIFFLPFLLFGARLEREQLHKLALWIGGLNLMAFGFAVMEFSFGIQLIFPYNKVTELIYRSKDVAGYTAYRVPSCFTSAHTYAGTMVMSVPILLGAWVQEQKRTWHGYLLASSLFASFIGVFMAAARVHVAVLLLLLMFVTFTGRLKHTSLVGWILMLCGLTWIVSSEARLQRFLTLQDKEYVTARIASSVNKGIIDLAVSYPLGNGLGGGGTSIPYFLQDLIKNPVLVENDYARIMLEQGVAGLIIWVVFILWVFTRRTINRSDPWYAGKRLAWLACAAYFVTGLIGTGLFTSVPQTCLLLLSTGWITVCQSTKVENSTIVPEQKFVQQYG